MPNERGDDRVAVRPQRVVPQLERIDAAARLAERIARRVIPDSLHDRYAREAVVEVHVTRPEDVLVGDERRQQARRTRRWNERNRPERSLAFVAADDQRELALIDQHQAGVEDRPPARGKVAQVANG